MEDDLVTAFRLGETLAQQVACRVIFASDWMTALQFSSTVYRMNYRDDLYRLLSCYVTITIPSISGCSEQRYENVPRDVKV